VRRNASHQHSDDTVAMALEEADERIVRLGSGKINYFFESFFSFFLDSWLTFLGLFRRSDALVQLGTYGTLRVLPHVATLATLPDTDPTQPESPQSRYSRHFLA
jgi:hypothetical protein